MRFVTKLSFTLAVASLLAACGPGPEAGTSATQADPTLAERLGHAKDAKLLIVHADDLGMSHAVNRATFDALASGQVTSASVMVPCPALPEVADYATAHPDADLGLHLTLTSDVPSERWGPVASKSDVPSLVDPQGYFFPGPREALGQIDAQHVETELTAQIQRARSVGLKPTHLDSHQFLLFFRPEVFEVYLRVGKDAGLPVFLARGLFSLIQERMAGNAPDYDSLLGPGSVVLDDLITMTPEAASGGWSAFYERALGSLSPGVTEIIVHVGYEEDVPPDLRGDEPFGSAWRQQEFDFFTGPEFGELLRKHDITLVSWRDIAGLEPVG